MNEGQSYIKSVVETSLNDHPVADLSMIYAVCLLQINTINI